MAVLALALLLAQIIPAPAGVVNGVVTGVVLSSNGMPSAGVRVYAIPASDLHDPSNSPVVFESLAQTDATGHYRLEVPGGRYYIAAGSVESPTYFPDTSALSAAKTILITAGTTVDGINFSKFVAATPAGQGFPGFTFIPVPQPPNSTGVLSGLIRFNDGRPAPKIVVIAVPLSTLVPKSTSFVSDPTAALSQSNNLTAAMVNNLSASQLSTMRLVRGMTQASTDNSGRFRLENLPPDNYYLVAGYADNPTYYPGTPDIGLATTINTTPQTMLDTVNFTIGSPSNGGSIRGRAFGMTGEPASGATLELHSLDPAATGLASLLPARTFKRAATGPDGSFEITDVLPGAYSMGARLPNVPPVSKNIVVSDRTVDLDITFPRAVFTASILWEDGSPVSTPVITEVGFRNDLHPDAYTTIIFSAASAGTFKLLLEPGHYRFFVRDLPQGYSIQSIRSGTTDLMRDPLDIGRERPANIGVRIAKDSAASNRSATTGKVFGKVLDASTGLPPSASRLQLCCFTSGPAEQTSTEVKSDGSFEFFNVPVGEFTADLRTSPLVRIVDPAIVVGSQGTVEQHLVSSSQFVSLAFRGDIDAGRLPEGTTLTVSLASQQEISKPEFRITQSGPIDVPLFAFVPAGVRYKVTVSEIPEALQLKSITSGITDLMTSPLDLAATAAPTIIQIKFTAREQK